VVNESHAAARRRRLLATLRDAGRPMTTRELADTLPGEVIRSSLSHHCPCRTNPHVTVVACDHGWYEWLWQPAAGSVYANLRELERSGHIASIRMDGVRVVCWQSVLTADEQAAFAALAAAASTP
jgi:hypothetical protein